MKDLVGLAAWSRSGKDECAKALLADGWQRLAFADGVRKLALRFNPWVWADVGEESTFFVHVKLQDLVDRFGWDRAKSNPEVRQLLIDVGNGTREVVGEQCLIEPVLRAISGDGHYVITDMRYPNEANAIRQMGGIVVRLRRTGTVPLGVTDHAVDLIEPDYEIQNDGTVEDLHCAIRKLVLS